MSKIKTTKQFKAGIDAAFETQKTRDADDLAKLGLVRVETMSMKLKPKAA